MSHLSERKEKNCLNCGTTVIGKYCHVCGQENAEPKETVWQLVSHFFSDITHFDGKFFVSIKDIIFKPGFLSKQYMSGKRVSYLNPIRMYLFTSFIFFLVFFSAFKMTDTTKLEINKSNIDKLDSVQLNELSSTLNGKPMTSDEIKKGIDNVHITFTDKGYTSKKQYDSLLKTGAVKDNWLSRKLNYKGIELNVKYRNNNNLAVKNLLEKVQHSVPQMLFIFLPLFALLLKFLNLRHKDFYYTDHAIFTIHFYIFVFIAMLIIFSISGIAAATGAGWMQWINICLIIMILFYLFKAMRNFYGQSVLKTFLKFFSLVISFLVIGIFTTSLFFFISFFEI